MKFDSRSILMLVCYLLAIYGLIVLIRKIMSSDKDKKWFSENYRYEGCGLRDMRTNACMDSTNMF